MTLFDPRHHPTVSPEDASAIVHAFLQNCVRWAEDKEIAVTQKKFNKSPSQKLAARLLAWTTYRDFTLHTLQELEDGTLDHWFEIDPPPDESTPDRI